MCTTTAPATAAEALAMLESAAGVQRSALGFLAAQDAASLPGPAVADQLRALERHDAVQAAVRGRLLAVFDAQDGHLADGQRSTRAWLVHSTRVTKGQAAQYQALQALARDHQVLGAALAEGWVLTASEALQLARWTRAIPQEYRAEDALSAPAGGGDLRTRRQRYHDALAEAMKRLLASDLLPQRAGQPVKALVHIYFAELRERDQDGILQDKWITEYRARWAAHRAAASVSCPAPIRRRPHQPH